MPSYGTGVGTPITPGPVPTDFTLPEWCTGALSLARYAQAYAGSECAFWGVSNASETIGKSSIWSLFQRREMARALCEAQQEIENVAGFFLQPRWIEEEPHDCSPTGTYLTNWNKLLGIGVAAVTAIQTNAPVDHTDDPAVIGSFPTTATDVNEIKIYYPNTTQEITPSNIVISSGTVTIYVPRCRLVKSDQLDNPDSGWDYSDVNNFQTAVDVYRIYNDTSDPGEFVLRTVGECPVDTLAICTDIKDYEIGKFLAYRANTSTSCPSTGIDQLRLNYVSGLTSLDFISELAIVRLAHSKLPGEPCGYDRVKEMWRSDNEIPVVLSVERLECPFGLSNGAWMAWKFAGSIAIDRLSVL